MLTINGAGDFDHFDSPKKSSLPALHKANPAPSFAPSTPNIKSLNLFRNPAFTTPQRTIDTDFSSGPENQSSPLADNEDTPEQPMRSGTTPTNSTLVMFQGKRSEMGSPSKNFPRICTPGRAERRPYLYTAISRRGLKRRRRDVEGRDTRLARRRPSDESDYEDPNPSHGSSAPPKTTATPPHEVGIIPSILTFVDAHPDLPDVLSRYAQFMLNLFFVGLLMFIVYCFFATIRSDVDEASREVAAETMAEMVACTREFKSNKCDSAERVPAMESMCNSWQKCMDRDPAMVGRARVSAQTFAEIITSFAEGISYKTMVCELFDPGLRHNRANATLQLFCSILFLGFWGISNVSLSVFRHKRQHYESDFQSRNPHPQHIGLSRGGSDAYFQYPGQKAQVSMGMTNQGHGREETESSGKQLDYR